ncbi:hypothetical protein AAFF_G00300800 [Aldrovandia affinis]|uniref:protein-tyrosine-phosphatase n=1 Tax=Aldrovandia affinis TaxID=143900 RepID=A0AAD7SRL3_9TELE|nr:hypothetical protein AAFF_G00300800 [Aldrovandia affinis]
MVLKEVSGCTDCNFTLNTSTTQITILRVSDCTIGNYSIRNGDNLVVKQLQPGTTNNVRARCSEYECCFQFTTRPDVIRTLTATQITTSSVSLHWTEPQGQISFYRVEWNDSTVSVNKSTNPTSVNITGLTAGARYTFSVVAIADDRKTEGDPVSKSVSTRPDVIGTLTATQITTSSVSLGWTEPQGQTSFYRVEWNNSTVSVTKSTNVTSVDITDLTAGARYTFSVVAIAEDRKTEGDPVNETLYTRPDVIRNLTVTQITTSSVSLHWTEPQGQISFYRVEWNDSTGSVNKSTNLTSVDITGLTAGALYTFSVVAIADDRKTEGDPVSKSVSTRPDVIGTLTATQITTSYVSLGWTEPQGQTSFYRVEWNNSTVSVNKSTNVTSVNITGLTAGARYTFSVVAIAEDRKTEGDSVNETLYTRSDVIKNLIVTQITTSSVSLHWTEPQGQISFYRVEWNDSTVSVNTSTNLTSVNITGLTAGARYTFSVVAFADDRKTEGDPVSKSVSTRPDVIRNLTVTQITTSSVSLHWTEPQGQISFYRVEWNDSTVSVNKSTNLTSVDITGLTAGARYTFSVVAIADDRKTEGDPVSKSVSTRSDVIRNLTVTQITTSSVSLHWTEPQGQISFYRVEWNNSTVSVTKSTNLTSVNITGLTAGARYTFSVVAIAEDRKTEGDPVNETLYTRPEKVEVRTEIEKTGNGSLGVSWSLPGNASSYELLLTNPTLGFVRNQTVFVREATFTGLSAGRIYNLTVTSVAGTFKTISDIFPFATRPNPPKVNSTERTNGSISLTWETPLLMEGVTGIGYIISYLNPTMWIQTNVSENKFVLSALSAGTKYNISLETVGPQGLRSVSVHLTEYTSLNPVENLRAHPLSTASVRLEWTAAVGVQQLVSYRVHSSSDPGNTTQANYEIHGLQPGTRYNFTVTPVTADGISGPADFTFCYTKPKMVENLTAIAINKTAFSLTWARQNDHKNTYSYLVSVYEASAFAQNRTTTNENANFNELRPGTYYTCNVFTIVASVQSDLATTKVLTKPDGASNVRAVSGTTIMNVTWEGHSGVNSSYSINIYNSNATLTGNQTMASNQMVVFSNLRPGQVYTVKVIILSGPYQVESETVTNATFPNPPGAIEVQEQTTSSINISWGRPSDMDLGQYNFTVFLHGRQLMTTDHSWALVGNLMSGTQYNISVATVGPMEYQSTPVTKSTTTRPQFVSQLRGAVITTSGVKLVWEQPEPKEGYTYFITVAYPNSSLANQTANGTSVTIEGLQSGHNYTFTVTTWASDGTTASPESITLFTRPFPVRELAAEPRNTTAVFLTWRQPQWYQVGYSYRVETTGCTPSPKNQSEDSTSTFVTDLRSGSNCSFTVYSQARNGIEGEPVSTYQYTKPEKLNPTASNGSTNHSITVTWESPNGVVEKFVVSLTSRDGPNSTQELSSNARSFVFSDLMAGRVYSITLRMTSGNFTEESEPVSSATYPNQPGSIRLQNTTTDSISLEWGGAPGMVPGSFNYSVVYQSASSNANTILSQDNAVSLSDLASGTSYNISVSTVGPLGFTSDAVRISPVTTRPKSIRSLQVVSTSVEEIHLKWEEPVDYKAGYLYRVVVVNNASNITDQTHFRVKDLNPGTQYTFSVTTLTVDGTEGSQESRTICTDAAPVTDLSCLGPNRTTPKLVLSWGNPKGANEGFEVQSANTSIQRYPTCNGNCSHNLDGLSCNTEYTVNVFTRGCGKTSTATPTVCKTGIAVPPVPSTTDASVTVKEHDKFTLQLSPSLFNDTACPSVNYGVLVTSDLQSLSGASPVLLQKFLTQTYEDWAAGRSATYLAVIKAAESVNRNGGNGPVVVIGDGTKSHSYNNGPLKASGSYSFAVVIFTHLELNNGLVYAAHSIFSISAFHNEAIRLPVNLATVGGAVGGAVAVLLILILALVIAVVCWKRRSKEESSEVPIYSIRAKVSVPIRVEDYDEYYREHRADSYCGFAEQFEDLKPVGMAQPKNSALALENKGKNRYNNVLPYDSSRVKLSIHGSLYDDYINANYMPGYSSRKEFIAAQGPLPSTVNEFWRMIWEKNVHSLVMLTRCNEQGRVKCEKYWPSETQHFNNITVTTTSEIPLEDWTIREFHVKNVKTAETRSLRHFHFTAWPDHGVPETTELLINFRHLVREHMDQYSRNSPTVVHCSAGVGRTGTFIAIDRLIFQIERDGVVDVYGVIHDLRMHRPLMVQTEDQYVFLNQCAMDIIRSRTGNNVDLIYQNTAALSIYENFEPKNNSRNGYRNT